MTPDEVDQHCATLAGCRRKGSAARPAWYVDDRLVVRIEDPTTLTLRCAPGLREELVAAHPGVFGVPPAMEKHLLVQVALDHAGSAAERDAVRRGLTAAWDLQRR